MQKKPAFFFWQLANLTTVTNLDAFVYRWASDCNCGWHFPGTRRSAICYSQYFDQNQPDATYSSEGCRSYCAERVHHLAPPASTNSVSYDGLVRTTPKIERSPKIWALKFRFDWCRSEVGEPSSSSSDGATRILCASRSWTSENVRRCLDENFANSCPRSENSEMNRNFFNGEKQTRNNQQWSPDLRWIGENKFWRRWLLSRERINFAGVFGPSLLWSGVKKTIYARWY